MNELIDATNSECAQKLGDFVNGNAPVAYFVGSGLSRPFYPSWPELALRMNESFRGRGYEPRGADFPTAAELELFIPADLQGIFQTFRDLDARLYIECIRDIFSVPPITHNGCTITILQSRPQMIATLNFDIAIEAAAQKCRIPVSSRYFPGPWFLPQTGPDTPVVMHLHGMFHDGLFDTPDDIILHTNSYHRYYEEGHREIFSLYAGIFLQWNVVFVGTALSEPEMAFFFQALHAHQAEEGRHEKKRLALIETSAARQLNDIEACKAVLREERSSDVTEKEASGIERARFFRKDSDFRGLDEILTTALGQGFAVPKPERIW